MNVRSYLSALTLCLAMAFPALAQDGAEQDSTGLPGDNFSLQGALEMFKKASSPEEFEKFLNSEDNKVNNLDLNEDGKTDYIRVINKKEKDVQIFILQALVSEKESQDIAVIELEKTGDENAIIQITGDTDIYGVSTIAEPAEEAESAFNYTGFTHPHGPAATYQPEAIIVNVWFWPCVRFVYAPAYTVWISPWTWARYPGWWRPWRPLPWYTYRPIRHNYTRHYVVVNTRRIPPARVMYRPVRTTSVTVVNRNRVVVNNYRTTRVRTTVNNSNTGSRQSYNNNNNNTRNTRVQRTTVQTNRGTRTTTRTTTNNNNNNNTRKKSRAARGN